MKAWRSAGHESQVGLNGDATSMQRSIVRSMTLALASARYSVVCFLLNYHLPLKIIFAALRRLRPIAIMGTTVIVTKSRDVREVLRRFDDFALGEILRPGIPWGPFLMTVDWREQHADERTLLQSVVCNGDVKTIRKVSADKCREKLGLAAVDHAERGRIDLVTELCEPVVVAITEAYFGIPAIKKNEPEMARIMSNIASLIMVLPPEGSRRWAEQRDSMVKLTKHLKQLLQEKRQTAVAAPNPSRPTDIFSRLAQKLCSGSAEPKWFDDDWVRRHMTGLAGTGTATLVRATVHAVDRLIAHPAALRRAQAVAATLDAHEEDERDLPSHATGEERKEAWRRVEETRHRLRQIVYEALRFRPMLPLLVRYSPRDSIIAKDTKRARTAPAGSRVIAAPLAAMFDPDAIEMPWRFCSSRPLEDLLHFGHGDRTCFGKYVADAAMLEVVRSLLRLPGLRRVSGPEGRVRYDGPVTSSLVLTFERCPPRT